MGAAPPGRPCAPPPARERRKAGAATHLGGETGEERGEWVR